MRVYQLSSIRDQLGESPFWSESDLALYWVDMLGRAIRRLDWSSGRVDCWSTPDYPTALALRAGGGAIVTLRNRVTLFDFVDGYETLCIPEAGREEQRLNEGRCAPDGRFWVGSMRTNMTANGEVTSLEKRSGALYRIDIDGGVQCLSPDIFGIPNTMLWTSRGEFITADSLDGVLYAYEYDAQAQRLGGRRVFSKASVRGVPDGSALDSEGCIWNARFGGGCVVRFTPDGEVDQVIDLPALNPTSCTFAGPDGKTLCVTSAAIAVPDAAGIAVAAQGAVFGLQTGVRGIADVLFSG